MPGIESCKHAKVSQWASPAKRALQCTWTRTQMVGDAFYPQLYLSAVCCSASAKPGAQEPDGASPVASPTKAPLGKTGAWLKKTFANAGKVLLLPTSRFALANCWQETPAPVVRAAHRLSGKDSPLRRCKPRAAR